MRPVSAADSRGSEREIRALAGCRFRYAPHAMTPLSVRLEAVLQLLRPCAVLADVGTDHGLLPVAAVQRGLAERAIAADLRGGPAAGGAPSY